MSGRADASFGDTGPRGQGNGSGHCTEGSSEGSSVKGPVVQSSWRILFLHTYSFGISTVIVFALEVVW